MLVISGLSREHQSHRPLRLHVRLSSARGLNTVVPGTVVVCANAAMCTLLAKLLSQPSTAVRHGQFAKVLEMRALEKKGDSTRDSKFEMISPINRRPSQRGRRPARQLMTVVHTGNSRKADSFMLGTAVDVATLERRLKP